MVVEIVIIAFIIMFIVQYIIIRKKYGSYKNFEKVNPRTVAKDFWAVFSKRKRK